MIQSPKVQYRGDGKPLESGKKSSLPNFTLAITDTPTSSVTSASYELKRKERAEKDVDILLFKLQVSDPGEKNGWDLRHSWDYWEDNEKEAYWEGAFAPGKLALIQSRRGPDQKEWPTFLRQWVKDERCCRF